MGRSFNEKDNLMKVGDLVMHNDMPKEHGIIGIIVQTYVDLDTCEVIWLDRGAERFMHHPGSLEVISESR